MANVSLKTDFKDGDKLFAQQLNNNFSAIVAALEAMNKIAWQDNLDQSLVYFKGTTEELSERDIIEGQLLYDYELGKAFIDHGNRRIEVVSGTLLDFVVNTLTGDEINKAPSVHAVNQRFQGVDTNISNLSTNKLDSSKISRGTSDPTGGTDGDIYFKYSE